MLLEQALARYQWPLPSSVAKMPGISVKAGPFGRPCAETFDPAGLRFGWSPCWLIPVALDQHTAISFADNFLNLFGTFTCLSLSLSLYLSISLSLYFSISPSLYLSISQPLYRSTSLSLYLSMSLSLFLSSISLSLYRSISGRLRLTIMRGISRRCQDSLFHCWPETPSVPPIADDGCKGWGFRKSPAQHIWAFATSQWAHI